ncbi:transglycosylase domain-containing protein [Salibacterium halotolerans]|uniref:Penicillin-binding protein 1A n=1 Tax=Salibacterium halotolerans TaxID=1884432 RepID=A0A1I5Q9M2_9BACI|nr:PBP1A family penicillin-binding protein [Salibacterium halotolerans]SFP42922.1 penicillin-binding protein 1A [Salibacterium halotolerans]
MSQDYRSRQEKRQAQQTSGKKNKKSSGKRSIFKKLFLIVFITGFLLVLGGGVAAGFMISNAPALDPEELVLSEAAEIYDQNGNQVTRLQSGKNRDLIDINNVPNHVKSAFIAVEDTRFYDHFGIDIIRVFGALKANLSQGFGAEGASTITQQVVKNAFLSPEKTISRKVQEQYLAIRLEQQYSKDQILQMYLNLIYFEQGAYGIGEASDVYFNKDVDELTIEDAALLAAIPRRPNHYEPIQNPKTAKERRNMIIGLMQENDFITQQEAKEAKSVTINEQLDYNPTQEGLIYDSFITHVQNEMEDVEGISSNELYSAGLKIYTTLDPEAQKYAEEVINTNQHISNYPQSDQFQVGFTLIDTQTGAIKAMVGNRQSQDIAKGFNYASNGSAQPGSTIKPLLDYAPAIEYNQWSTYHQLVDEPHTYTEDGDQQIQNYSGTFRGSVSMRQALVDSINVPAVKALQQTGLQRAGDFARGLGLPIENVYPAAALGGISPGFSSVDMAGAYAAFGNEGTYSEPHAVRRIEFRDGREITMEHETSQAMQDYTAYMITDMLKDVVDEGTGTGANIPDLPLAGKTGTTNFTESEHEQYGIPDGGDPDIWFAGYTPRYTAAVWTGFSSDRGENYLIGGESDIAKEIFRLVMSHVSEGTDTPEFTQPDSVNAIDIERSSGQRASRYTPESQIITELFVEGTGPEEVSDTFSQPESITGLNAVYDEQEDAVQVSWDYDQSEQSGRSFQVEHRTENGSYETVSNQSETGYTMSVPKSGVTHSFRITVVNEQGPNQTSSSSEVQVNVPENNENMDEEEEDSSDSNENEDGEDQQNDNSEDAGGSGDSGSSGSGESDNNDSGNNEDSNTNNDNSGDSGSENNNTENNDSSNNDSGDSGDENNTSGESNDGSTDVQQSNSSSDSTNSDDNSNSDSGSTTENNSTN